MVLSIDDYNNIYNYVEKNIEPKFDNYIQLYRFKEKCQNFYIKDNKLYTEENKLVLNSKTIKETLNNECKNVIGGRDKLYFHIKNKYYKVTKNDIMNFINLNEINQLFKKLNKNKVVKLIISNKINKK